ncbi:MAG: alpha/beta hydrolase fold domain-containing protein [Anaerolineae bacterium]
MIEPQDWTFENFPESTAFTEGVTIIPADHSGRSCKTHIGIEYAHKSGMPLHLHIIEPEQHEAENLAFPLIMFIQGSAWFQQDNGTSVAQLSRFAQRGFVIAIVEYRPSPVAPFPAQIKDAKTAIRFLKKHAETYHADPENIIVWGTSSGGHTAVMTGLTLGNQALDDRSAIDDPIVIKAIVDYYGPTDISKMNEEPSIMDHIGPDSPEGMLIGGLNVLENLDKAQATNPLNYIPEGDPIPPILIVHGSKDRLVPFGQSVMLFDALKKANKIAECIQLKGADHGGPPFWTEPIFDQVETFVRKYL